MDQSGIISELRNLGWTTGSHIPVSNEENKVLENQLQEILKERAEGVACLQDMKTNLTFMINYRKQLQEQKTQNQEILLIHRLKIEKDENSVKILDTEEKILSKTLRDVKKEGEDLVHYKENLQLEYESAVNQCNELQSTVEFEEELINIFNENIFQQEKDTEMLQKYKLEDDACYKKLEVNRVKLIEEMEEFNKLLQEKTTTISMTECEIEETNKRLKKIDKERSFLITQWEGAINALKRRDQDIQNTVNEINILKEIIRTKYNEWMEHENFYKEQVRDNLEVTIENKLMCKQIQKEEIQNQIIYKEFINLESEFSLLKNELRRIGDEITRVRCDNDRLTKEIIGNKEKENHLKEICNNLSNKLEILQNCSDETFDRTSYIDEILQDEKHTLKCTNHNRNRLETLIRNVNIRLMDLQEKSVDLYSNTKRLHKIAEDVDKEIVNSEKRIQQENERLVSKELEYKDIISKINEITKKDTEKVRNKKQNEFSNCAKELKEMNNQLNLTKTEVNNNQEELVRLEKKVRKLQNEIEDKLTLKEDYYRESLADEKLLEKMINENEEKQVEENIVHLKINRLENALNEDQNNLLNLNKEKIEIDAASKERQIEIELMINSLKTRKRMLSEEHSSMKRVIEQISNHVQQLVKKYEIIMESIGKDENGQVLTLTNYRIKMVEERYKLLERGDELDGKIRKAEKEIQAMENTLRLVNVCNQSYKMNISSIKIGDKETEDTEELQKQYDQLSSDIKTFKRKLNTSKDKFQSLLELQSELTIHEHKLKETNVKKESMVTQFEKEINEQQIKLERTFKRITSITKYLKKNIENSKIILDDIVIRIMKEGNENILRQLAEMSMTYIETKPVIHKYLTNKNIAIPYVQNIRPASRSRLSSHTSSKRTIDEVSVKSKAMPDGKIEEKSTSLS